MVEVQASNPEQYGLLLINKNAGVTSFDVVNRIRNRLGKIKVGHTGTLDKFATGLLMVLTGECTKLNNLFLALDKEYRAEVFLGRQTDTLDPEGSIVSEGSIPSIEEIRSVIPRFIGEIKQVPPLYSALHVKGERAYQIARRGDTYEIPARTIRIDSIKIIAYEPPHLTIDVSCSCGTYIRSLARDIGNAAGSCGYLTALTRTRIGSFSLAKGIDTECRSLEKNILRPFDFSDKIPGLLKRVVKNEYIEALHHGVKVRDEFLTESTEAGYFYALFDEKEAIHAVVKKENSVFSYFAVMNRDL
jgi:tRNA pseudouridine55 synthase